MLKNLLKALGLGPKPKRLKLRFVPQYPDGDRLCQAGWTIAKEDDLNNVAGWVFLELLEPVDG